MLLVLFKKFIGRRTGAEAEAEVEPIESIISRIQDGDIRLRNRFIADYQPYVARVTSRFSKRYIDPSRDDEFTVALAAFNEAINQFSSESGRSFFGFAETVIRRRLIDYVRKEQRHIGQTPLSSFEIEDDEENVLNPVEVHEAIERYEQERTAEERRNEIMEFSGRLGEFGISFNDLVEASPKHVDSRHMLFGIAYRLAHDAGLMERLIHAKTLPIKELLELVDVSRKTLERNRKYIIALSLIYYGPYPYLRDYLHIPDSPEGRSAGHE